MKFFNKTYSFYKPTHHTFITEIKKELKRYNSNLRINPLLVDDFEKKEEANFVYSSLNLEGNPLTLPETQKLVLDWNYANKENTRRI